ncbi:probable 4-coumarate--CoA ligase 3 [Odontomachus brunneus]|uniref:probable 4-coumarate--CoA ligase 3 n=1 Tax=Odontomachus brunneus TaxID=486640 RepID=UPI0013F2B17F|nr:probable 4-coumarate--CoA ligase 3 [Odontomachus brunneus]
MEFIKPATSLSEKKTTRYPPPCKIVDNVVIGEEAPVYRECVGIGELVYEQLSGNPEFVGLIDTATERQATFAEIKDRSVRCALWLRSRGIQPGDIIGIATHNHLDCVIPLLGCLYVGALFYPMHFKLNIHDSRYFIALTKPKIIFANVDMADILAQAVTEEDLKIELVTFGEAIGCENFDKIINNPDQDAAAVDEFRCRPIASPDEIGLIVCSSGSTGLCKASMYSHSALINNMLYDKSFAEKDDKMIMWLSSFRWISGAILPLRSIYFHKTWIICPEYKEELLCQIIEKYNVTWMLLQSCLTTSVLKYGFFHKYRLPSLKKLIIGGAYMKPYLFEAVIKALPHTKVLFTYGTSEVGGVYTLQREGDKIGSSGYILSNSQLKVIAVDTGRLLGPCELGELLLKSPCMMTRYYNNSQAMKETLDKDGWIHTGDLGYYDTDGEIYVCDRIKEIIKVRGCYVFPNEIESVLQSHPAVRKVAVVRVKNDLDDEHPLAFVTKIPGKEVTAEELVKLVADKLEDHKHLRAGVQFLDELLYTDTGKIARKRLRELAERLMVDPIPAEYTE